MAKKKLQVGAENGVTIKMDYSGDSVGASVDVPGMSLDMLESGLLSFPGTLTVGSDGEPKAVLLAMAWTAIETLLARNEARIFVGTDEVAVIFQKTALNSESGLVPTDEANDAK